MAKQVMSDVRLYVGAYDLSGSMNALALDLSRDLREVTGLTHDGVARVAGLADIGFAHAGYFEAGLGQPDPGIFAALDGGVELPMTLVPTKGAAAGSVAYGFKSLVASYRPGASVGEAFAFDVSGQGNDPPVRGVLMFRGTVTGSGNGVAFQLGAVGASEYLYGALHVYAVSAADTLDVIVESDSQEDFAGTPSTRITFAQATAPTSEWATPVAGAIADDWWRISYTAGGAAISIGFAGFVGIQ